MNSLRQGVESQAIFVVEYMYNRNLPQCSIVSQ